MNVSIFGLGYVGCISAGCLASLENNIIGVDIALEKVKLINNGKPTVIEKDLEGYIEEGRKNGRIEATIDVDWAVLNSDISLITANTPEIPREEADMINVYQAAERIGKVLAVKADFHVVVIRSDVVPGTNAKIAEILEKFSGKKRGKHFSVISNPEFLHQGSAVNDYLNPTVTVIGSDCTKGKDRTLKLYEKLKGEKLCTNIKVAEMVKYINSMYYIKGV